MPTIKVNDINIHYEIHGEGEPLVLIGGLGTDQSIFKLCLSRFSQKFKVLIFDNRGSGQTDKPDIPYSIDMLSNDTAALMDAVGIEFAHILGISMGGRVAMSLTLRYPGKVKSLILVSTAANVKSKLPYIHKALKWIRSKISKDNQPYYAFKRQLYASRSYDCSSRLNEIKVPTLILHGRNDKLVKSTQAEEMKYGINEANLVVFNGGHLFFLWENKKFVDAVFEFLMR
ncbi:alpha/beta fold hydrolase [Desulfosporosinus sp. SB140]|uniref:alpha/beta fold hydrolase n=1 Tax=Desulfosporosinus paludis TaxID=3115649 RepID=UPI003890A9C9